MGTNGYSPFDHLNGKLLWDQAIADRGALQTDKWLHIARTVVGLWLIEKWLDIPEFMEAILELKDLCAAAGWNSACVGCSSRATVHKCSECSNKGES